MAGGFRTRLLFGGRKEKENGKMEELSFAAFEYSAVFVYRSFFKSSFHTV